MRGRGLVVWGKRLVLAVVVMVLLLALVGWLMLRASLAQLDGTLHVPGLDAQASVARDAHGVPLISGASRLDVAYATGFVHAQERYFQMDLLRRVAAGELSELFGARALPLDRSHRLHRFRARAELALQVMDAADRALLDRYVAGVNAGLAGLSVRPFEYALVGLAPRAWRPADSLLVIWAMYFDLQGSQEPRELARGWFREHSTAEQRAFLAPDATQWDAPLDVDQVAAPADAAPASAPAWWGRAAAAPVAGPASTSATAPGSALAAAAPDSIAASLAASLAGELLAGTPAALQNTVGSNNWAVAGSRSLDGAAIVSNDMHLGLQLPAIWYRAALEFPDPAGGRRRVVGVTLPGAPVVVVGSNGHVAWGYTNSYGDYLDLVALDTDPAKPGQLRTPAGWETPATSEEIILVKGAPADRLLVRDTSLGPVRESQGRSYAVRWVAHALAAVNLNARRMEWVNTLDEALAVAPTLGIPAQNFVGGDSKGNIGWTIAGPLPRRVAPGPASSYPLAADDPAVAWDGWLAPADYPQVRNPVSGQLATANSRQLMGAGAQLIGDGGFDLGARTHQVRDDLSALGARTEVRDVYAITLDDHAVFMAGWRQRAIDTLDVQAIADNPQRTEALQLLKNGWTGHASVDSVGYRLARGYLYALYDICFEGANAEMARIDPKASMAAVTSRWPVVLERLLDERPAGWLPPGHAGWRELRLAALDRVIADLTRGGKPLSAATWGQRNTATTAHPFAAVVPLLGGWLKVAPDMLPGDAHMPRVAGPAFGQSERLTVSPGREEQGVFNLPAGQSGHPLSPYFLDGRAQWLAGTPTPLLPGEAVHTLTFLK